MQNVTLAILLICNLISASDSSIDIVSAETGLDSECSGVSLLASRTFSDFESPYYIFQLGPGPAWINGAALSRQNLTDHFIFMGQLEQSGVLIHGGPLDRGNGGYALGVIRAGSIYEACEAISRDPALALGVYELLSLDRWLAVAGSDEPIDRNEIRRNTNQN